MSLLALDHVNIRTENLDAMVKWYTEVLGLTPGKRPSFGVGGAWLYVGENAVVHLVEQKLPPKSVDPRIEHFALRATGLLHFLERLDAHGVHYTVDAVPDFPVVQVNLADCDGNHIHVDFPAAEHKPTTG